MNRAFMDEIVEAFTEMNADDEVRAVIVTGNGRAFMLENLSKPVIAAVNGFALGGGFEIACACDLIIASKEAKFGLPEVHLGLVPGGGGTQRLIQKLSINRIKQMLFLGDQYTAEQMREWGVVNYVTEPEELEAFTVSIAQKLARRSPAALAELKRLVYLRVEGSGSFVRRGRFSAGRVRIPAGAIRTGTRAPEAQSRPEQHRPRARGV